MAESEDWARKFWSCQQGMFKKPVDENPNLDFEKFEFGTFPLQYGHQQDSIMIKIENG